MPERVIHTTRMDSRDPGFSLTANWCVVWDPPLVAQLCCSSHWCSTSLHYLVTRRYILAAEVWPPFGTLAQVPRENPRRSWDPTFMAPSPLVVNNARGLVGTAIVVNSSSRSATCCSFCWDVTTISSTYAWTFRPNMGASTLSISRW